MTRGAWTEGSYVLKCYLDEIEDGQLLTADEELEVARRIKAGDRAAIHRLLECNLRFVVSVAKRYQNKGMPLEDLIAEGNLGLIKAVMRFDESRGFKFISYAVWWIKQSILEALSQKSRMVRLPMNRVDAIVKIRRASHKLREELHRKPTLQEVADAVDMSPDTVVEVRQSAEREISLEETRTEEGKATLLRILEGSGERSDTRLMYEKSLQSDIRDALETLTEREADIIRLYYGLGADYPKTLGDIGDKYGLSRERVRQIKATALHKLRRPRIVRQLKKYLGEPRD